MKVLLPVCLAFALTGTVHCADDGPTAPLAEQNGLAFHLIIPKPHQVQWGQLKVQIVLKNVSTRSIRAVTRCGRYAGEGAGWSSIDLDSFFPSDRPRDEDFIRSIATIPPGESLVLPADCPIPKERPYRMVVSYSWSKEDAKRFGCWEGSVGTSVMIANLSSGAELKSDEHVNVVSFRDNTETGEKIRRLLADHHITAIGLSNAGWVTYSVSLRDENTARGLLIGAIMQHQIDAMMSPQTDTIAQPNDGGDSVIYQHPGLPAMVGDLQAALTVPWTLTVPGKNSEPATMVPLVVKAYGTMMTFSWSPDARYLLIATDLADGSGKLGLVDTRTQPIVERDLKLAAIEPRVAAQLPQSPRLYGHYCVVNLSQSDWPSSTQCHIYYCYKQGRKAGDIFLGLDTTEATPTLKIENVTTQD
jgi:hypothetical protein